MMQKFGISFGSFVVSANRGFSRAHDYAFLVCRKVVEPDHHDLESWELLPMYPAEVYLVLRDGSIALLPFLAVWEMTRANLGL